jgi:hypothetical protein
MPRTSSAAVSAIIEVEPSISVTPFIEVANALVEELLAPTAIGYDATRLELIERWLSAHFYAIRDMRAATEQAKSISQGFQYKVDLYLANTMYGQQVLILDTAGVLAALQKRVIEGTTRPGMAWLGTDLDSY